MRDYIKPGNLIPIILVVGLFGWFGLKIYEIKQYDKRLYREAESKKWIVGATVANCKTIEHKGKTGATTGTSQECSVQFVTNEGQRRSAYLSPIQEHRYGDRVTILYHPEKLKDPHGLNFVWEYR